MLFLSLSYKGSLAWSWLVLALEGGGGDTACGGGDTGCKS